MFIVERSIVIERPPARVFEYVANPLNTPAWRRAVLEVTGVEGPIAVGSTFGEVVSFMGRKTFGFRVTALEPGHRIVMAAESGPPIRPVQTYLFEPAGTGVRVTVRAEVTAGGLFRLLEPLLRSQFAKAWEEQLAALKQVLGG